MYVENDGLWFLKGITSNTKQNVKESNLDVNFNFCLLSAFRLD